MYKQHESHPEGLPELGNVLLSRRSVLDISVPSMLSTLARTDPPGAAEADRIPETVGATDDVVMPAEPVEQAQTPGVQWLELLQRDPNVP